METVYSPKPALYFHIQDNKMGGEGRSHPRSPTHTMSHTHPASCWEAERICHPTSTRGLSLRIYFAMWPVCPPPSGVFSNSKYYWVPNEIESDLPTSQ